MNTDKLIGFSLRVYGCLLGLYPKEHRAEYGQEMTRLFSDQCRSAIDERGKSGLLALWLRTFVDLCKTALVEHFSSPRSTAGLLQATPGKPLSWKGVALVLIPGLVFFICQIGTLNGKDWFFSILPWLGYACLVPAVLVWILTRKIPVWGLIPLGLVLAAIRWDLQRWVYDLSLSFVIPLRSLITPNGNNIVGDGMLGTPLIFFAIALLLGWLAFRRYKFNRTVWLWLGFYTLTVIALLATYAFGLLKSPYEFQEIRQAMVFSVMNANNADSIFFLLLILLGALLARRHGKLAILVLVGYLLPTILYGHYLIFSNGTTADLPLAWIHSSILAFRVCLAILIPIWLTRSTSWRGQVLATMLPVTIALVAENGLHIARYVLSSQTWQLNYVSGISISLLMTMSGFMLALVMYRSIQPTQPAMPTTDTPTQTVAEA